MNIYKVIILDESGSMSSIYRQTLQSMNEVLSGIRRDQEMFPDQRHNVTIVTFEGQNIRQRRDRVPVERIKNFTEKDYRPGGCTPLYDAMGKTLNRMEGLVAKGDQVMVTIITDGYENASREYSGRTVKALVSRLREKDWVFAYIGANQDAVEVAHDLSIANALNYDATPEGVSVMKERLKMCHNKMARGVACKAGPEYFADLFNEDA